MQKCTFAGWFRVSPLSCGVTLYPVSSLEHEALITAELTGGGEAVGGYGVAAVHTSSTGGSRQLNTLHS